MSERSAVAVIVCAAGLSSRMGGVKKEYQKIESLGGLTALEAVVSVFAKVQDVEIIVIAVNGNLETAANSALSQNLFTGQKPKILFVAGGTTRQSSVFNALSILADYDPDYVLIHDGARPWVSLTLIGQIITAAKKHGAAIPLLPLTDTPKECYAPFGGQSAETEPVLIKTHLKRANTGIAQTPQGFLFAEILQAHTQAALEDEEFTDDAEVWGKFCGEVAVVTGSPENRKITYPEDIR